MIHQIKQTLGEGAYHWFFIIIDNILEELIDKLHLKICKIESGIIIRIELICKI